MTIADINTETRALCDADSTSYTAADLLRRTNNAYEEIVGKLIARNSNWQFDDTNFSTFPIGVTTLVASQEDYTLDVTHLIIERVQVKDNSGIWRLLQPMDRQNLTIPPEEFMKTDGLPIYYDKTGRSVILYPAPATANVTLTDGLRIYFQRTADIFTSAQVTTGTKVPGFPSPYHILLCYKVALPFCLSYKKDRVPLILSEINRLEKELLSFKANEEKDEPKIMKMGSISFR